MPIWQIVMSISTSARGTVVLLKTTVKNYPFFFFSFLCCFAILYNRDAAKLLSLTNLVIFSFLAKV